MKIFLTDNGSLRPASVRSLRRLSRELSKRTGLAILPASLLHTNRIPAEELGGHRAPILEEQISEFLSSGERRFGVIPLFFGPSRALTEYIPAVEARLRKKTPEMEIIQARPLVEEGDPETIERVGTLLERGIQDVVSPGGSPPQIILVDHGTPEIRVNRVRELLGDYLREKMTLAHASFQTAAMERREGPEYAFNDPLLESVLLRMKDTPGPIVVSLLFLQPGRHAGPGGDIAQICEGALPEKRRQDLRFTPLVGEMEGILPILEDRVGEIQQLIRPGRPIQ